MKSLLFCSIVLLRVAAFGGFLDEGYSNRSCLEARQDALFLAKANCLSLGALDSKNEVYSKCKKSGGRNLVSISYTCDLQETDFDDYDPDFVD